MAWQLGVFMGVVMLALGLVVALHPSTSLNVLCVFIGIIVLVGGVIRLIRSLNAAEVHRALTATLGVLMIVVGLVLIRHLHLSRLLVAFFVGVVFIVQGASDLLIGASGEIGSRRVVLIVFGLISIGAGIVVLAVPENSVTFLATLVGIWFMVLGVLQVLTGLIVRHGLRQAGA